MLEIFETDHFVLEAHPRPEIDRLEGGHMKISPKTPVKDRSHLSPEQAIELMRLTIVAGIALKAAMKEVGIDIGRINYQDNGNWNPTLHVHMYGRAKGAVIQTYGDPFVPGHRSEYALLTEDDAHRIRKHIKQLLAEDRYSDEVWGLK